MLIATLILYFSFVPSARSQSTYVPLNHWVYDYLERLEARQVIQGVLNASKPLSRIEIAQYLAKVYPKFES
ncbi:MAG: hypothetical protein ONB16_13205, partial [candidate division KSB1 bacterium]|nr:hypothetical protein [candidate division KSB1 bacterium]